MVEEAVAQVVRAAVVSGTTGAVAEGLHNVVAGQPVMEGVLEAGATAAAIGGAAKQLDELVEFITLSPGMAES